MTHHDPETLPKADPVRCICCGNTSEGYLPPCGNPAHQYCYICLGRGHEEDHECEGVANG